MTYIMIPITIAIVAGCIAAAVDQDAFLFIPIFIVTGLTTGMISLMIYAAVSTSETSEQRKAICTEKGGVVEDNSLLCIVNGRPVEYSPGEWEYDR